MSDKNAQQAPCTAPELLLKLVLAGTQSHYENRGVIDDKRLEHLLHAGKQILFKSHQESDVRQNLGFSPAVWQGLTSVLTVAIPSLEHLCFIYKCSNPQTYSNSSSELVAANCITLVKEIERLNDLCTVARNLLATTKRAQNLAADRGFDQQILKLIDVCVKVTARGFDGTNPRVEERHQKVCNLFKRLLITCLQFLHNFIMHNEHRKLVLWLDLFGNAPHHGLSSNGREEHATVVDSTRGPVEQSTSVAIPSDEAQHSSKLSGQAMQNATTQDFGSQVVGKLQTSQEALQTAVGDLNTSLKDVSKLPYTLDDVTVLFDVMNGGGESDQNARHAAKMLMERIKNDMETLSGMTAEQLDNNPEILMKVGAALRAQLPSRGSTPKAVTGIEPSRITEDKRPGPIDNRQWPGIPDMTAYSGFLADQEVTEDDLIMPRTSSSAAETLQEAKDELMTRLHEAQPKLDAEGNDEYDTAPPLEDELDEEIPDSLEGSIEEDEEDDEEDDYHNANDQERGLLTDVPLVLGPTEIEALPMIIQAGIVDNFGGAKNSHDRQGARNMQAVRCHILLAQEAGRNVLRELLIFIAAWDLPDDEFYFKMMVQIMESILKNGLMSHAYSDFGQAKDIISPAQAVVIKILTHIFRTKYSPSSGQNNNEQPPPRPKVIASLTRVDILTVRYIFTVFRGNIIPETCALIYLQGQIRAGLAEAEDFPLNLWDMERVYEGVYQFLEFFAVLTENNDWKRLLVKWEIVYDLVTLLKELDASILKAPFMVGTASSANKPQENPNSSSAQVDIPSSNGTEQQPHNAKPPHSSTANQQVQPPSTTRTTSPPPPPTTPSEDPSTFEWRNLKKLIILVLSSLVWKNPQVQSQIREHAGVETVLSCTNYDGHNPYIKEHAVMCLKFLLEGNKENQDIVKDLEAKGVVDSEGIQKDFGISVRVDSDGKVKVGRRADSDEPMNNNNTNNKNIPSTRQRNEKARRIARGASESNAAAELLGERFADLNVRDNSMKERFVEVIEGNENENDNNDGADEIEFM